MLRLLTLILVLSAAQPTILKPSPGEKHLKNIRQLTFGGQNAEAYLSADNRWIIFQSTHGQYTADQVFTMRIDGSDMKLVSTGKGRCTCAYFFPNGKEIVYAGTHADSPEPPPPPDMTKGYVWPVYPGYTIYKANRDGTGLRPLTNVFCYNAEATVSRDGKKIVFTSMRDGDLDVYSMDADGKNVKRLTNELGYDGGPWFSPNGKLICYRAYHPTTAAEKEDYKSLLSQNLIRPTTLDLWIMNADGTNKRRVTNNHAANFCPFFTPDGKKLIFSSNLGDPKGREFDLYLINLDGSGLERITTSPEFDGFPMFTSDFKKLVWASNRNGKSPHETNIFIADWVK